MALLISVNDFHYLDMREDSWSFRNSLGYPFYIHMYRPTARLPRCKAHTSHRLTVCFSAWIWNQCRLKSRSDIYNFKYWSFFPVIHDLLKALLEKMKLTPIRNEASKAIDPKDSHWQISNLQSIYLIGCLARDFPMVLQSSESSTICRKQIKKPGIELIDSLCK